MIRQTLKTILGILLVPFATGLAFEFYGLLIKIRVGLGIHHNLVYGFLAYLFIHLLLHKPIMTYIFAHEFTHAIWAIPFGGKLKDFRAGQSGGHAMITRSNIWVALAPYFFPFYTYLVLGFFGIFIAFDLRAKILPYICFLVGFTLSFHLIFTIQSLIKKQSDLKDGGIVLSMVLIFIMNLFFISLTFKILAPHLVHFIPFLKDSFDSSIYLVLKLMDLVNLH